MINAAKHIYNGIRDTLKTIPIGSGARDGELRAAYSRAYSHAKQVLTGTSPIYKNELFSGMRYYGGADTSRTRAEWSTTPRSMTDLITTEYRPLVARSELCIRTNPYAQQAQRIFKDHVVGGGYRPFPAVKDRSGKMVDSVNKVLEEDWKRFNDQGIRTGSAEMTVSDSMGFVFSEIFADGGVLCNTVNSKNGSWLPIALQFVKTTNLDWSKDNYLISNNSVALNKKNIIHGMILDSFGSVEGYHIDGVKDPISSDRMKIFFRQRECQQFLAFPWLAPVLPTIYDLDQVLQNRMFAMRILESIAFWIKKSSAPDIVAGANDDDEIPIDRGLIMKTKDKPEVVQSEDRVSETFAPLVRLYLHSVAAGLGFSYVLLTRDLSNVNFASTRYNYIHDNQTFTELFRWFSKISYCKYVWETFVKWEFLTGKIPNYTFAMYQSDPWYYSQVYWLPEGREWVDPLKDNQALKLAYDSGWLTFQDICALKGKDWRAVLGQHAIEKEKMVELGLERFINTGTAGQQAQDKPNEVEDEEVDQPDEPVKTIKEGK